jgi:UDP-GlcNAc:undecaprenyl-phosphate GlcNAc-1-phosphate transferase
LRFNLSPGADGRGKPLPYSGQGKPCPYKEIGDNPPVPLAAVFALTALSAALSQLLTPLILRYALRKRVFDAPGERKVHTRRVPRLGGVAVFAAVSIGLTAAMYGAVLGLYSLDRLYTGLILWIYLGLCGFFFIGFFDDIRSLPALSRLLGQLFVATAVVIGSGPAGIRITAALGVYRFPEWLSIAISVLWIVGVVNTFNWIDGLDGLSSGVAGISATAFLVLALAKPFLPYASLTAIICAVLVGAIIGFLPYNFFPARIFIGDGGAFTLGYLLAVTSIVGLFKQAAVISFIVPLGILALPLADTLFAILRRLVKRQPVTKPDNRHIHHRMLSLLSRRYRERLDSDAIGLLEEKFIARRAHRDTVLWLYGVTLLFAGLAVWLGLRA